MSDRYGQNHFTFSGPSTFVRFYSCIGPINMQKFTIGDNVHLTKSFFEKNKEHNLAYLWFLRWTAELILAMKSRQCGDEKSLAESKNIAQGARALEGNCSPDQVPDDLWKAVAALREMLEDMDTIEEADIAADELGMSSKSRRPIGRLGVGMKPSQRLTLDFGGRVLGLSKYANSLRLPDRKLYHMPLARTSLPPIWRCA